MKHNRICPGCGHPREPNRKCLTCGRKYNREYYVKNRRELIDRQKKRQQSARANALKAYGGRCDCCGESSPEFLAIDHIKGGGDNHRRFLYGRDCGSSHSFYIWLRDRNYPKEFRLLCHNCNMSLGLYGYCPHKREQRIPTIQNQKSEPTHSRNRSRQISLFADGLEKGVNS